MTMDLLSQYHQGYSSCVKSTPSPPNFIKTNAPRHGGKQARGERGERKKRKEGGGGRKGKEKRGRRGGPPVFNQ